MRRREFVRVAALAVAAAACSRVARPMTGWTALAEAPSIDPVTDGPSTAWPPAGTATPHSSAAPSPDPATPDSPEAATKPSHDMTSSEAPGSPSSTATTVFAPRLCRDSWGAAAPTDAGRAHTVRGIIVHHSGTAAAGEPDDRVSDHLRSYQRYHQEQGWPDIAYHVAVDRDGLLWELRDPAIAGDTFTDYDPTGSLLVLVDGDFDDEDPSEAQLEGVARVLAWATDAFAVSLDEVTGHRDHAHTRCPGDGLARHLDDGSLRRRAATLVTSGGVRAPVVCGAEAQDLLADADRAA